MGATARDLEKADKLTARIMVVVKFLAFVFRPFLRLGLIQRRLDRTLGGRIGTINRLSRCGKHEEAAALATESMKECWDLPPGDSVSINRAYRWYFMRLAAEDLERCGAHSKLDNLIEWANAETERSADNQAARSYLCFSQSKYRRGDREAAIRYAQIASEFDETWAEPDVVLGWYALVLREGNAQEYLTRAVQKDPRILSRIEKEPVCQQHPHIIQKLKRIAAEGTTRSDHEPNV